MRISTALPYALFDTAVSGVSEKDQYNGKIVFDGVVESAKTALANGIPAGLGGDVTGCIAPGKSADFIVTRKNPLENLRALQHLELVVCRSRSVKKPSSKRKKELNALLDPYLV